jgi:hypothetical protein
MANWQDKIAQKQYITLQDSSGIKKIEDLDNSNKSELLKI